MSHVTHVTHVTRVISIQKRAKAFQQKLKMEGGREGEGEESRASEGGTYSNERRKERWASTARTSCAHGVSSGRGTTVHSKAAYSCCMPNKATASAVAAAYRRSVDHCVACARCAAAALPITHSTATAGGGGGGRWLVSI